MIVKYVSETRHEPEGKTVSMVTGAFVLWREMYGEVQLLYYQLERDNKTRYVSTSTEYINKGFISCGPFIEYWVPIQLFNYSIEMNDQGESSQVLTLEISCPQVIIPKKEQPTKRISGIQEEMWLYIK